MAASKKKSLLQCPRTRKEWMLLLVYLFAICLGMWIVKNMFTYLDTETYIWQSTTLAAMISPTHRTTCDIGSPSVVNQGAISIAMVMLFDDKDGTWDNDLMRRIVANHEAYCKRHGYTMILANNVLDPSRPPAWSKIRAVQQQLPKFDYVVYIDMDVVIMNPDVTIESFIYSPNLKPYGGPSISENTDKIKSNIRRNKRRLSPLNSTSNNSTSSGGSTSNKNNSNNSKINGSSASILKKATAVESNSSNNDISNNSNNQKNTNINNIDMIMTEDWNGPNTGIWITKNTEWARNFLETCWKEGEQMVTKYNKQTNTPYPFEYEQRVVHYLLHTAIWSQRAGLPHYDAQDVRVNRQHVYTLPQCSFNSYSLHPFYWHGDRDVSQYVPNDFLIHFAGKKGEKKKRLLDYYLNLAKN